MGEKTIKVSDKTYDKVKTLSERGDMTMRDITDDLVSAGLKELDTVTPLVEHLDKESNIEVRKVDGLIYFCQGCRHPLDPENKLSVCPDCQTKLAWNEMGKQGAGLGVVGWGFVGLALLLALGAKRRA